MLIPLDNSFGAWLIGLIVSAVLFGVTCLQVYLYFTKHCTRDPAFVKSFVALLLVHAIGPTGLDASTGSSSSLHSADRHLVLLSVQVQLFYAFRIYIISNKQLVMPIIIISEPWLNRQAICAFAELGMWAPCIQTSRSLNEENVGLGIVFMRKTFETPVFINPDMIYPASALSLVVVCDVLVAAAMIYYLLKNRSEFQNGALTMVFAICSLVTLLALNTMIYTPFFFVTVRLYALSFMTMYNFSLNCREHVREQLFSSQATFTLPTALSNIARPTDDTHESIVFDNRSKNETQVV
ncbi:hypothetical protein DFH06DRAFT_1124147 [Mycena polygramma]|nr:hypothetical protein DFH06DRAFT_1124147 [Mycena polygramma]